MLTCQVPLSTLLQNFNHYKAHLSIESPICNLRSFCRSNPRGCQLVYVLVQPQVQNLVRKIGNIASVMTSGRAWVKPTSVWANDACSFITITIILSLMWTIEEWVFTSCALDVVHCKAAWDASKVRPSGGAPERVSKHPEPFGEDTKRKVCT